jgi:hypothetical protein
MSGSSPSDRVQEIVVLADRRRRSRDAIKVLVRFAPMAAGALLAFAFLTRIFSWPAAVPPVLGAALVLALVATVVVLGRRRPSTDAIAAHVDDDAALRGELRSAHWFAATPGRPANDEWADFHLGRAVSRAEQVDWTSLYPPVRAARTWAATGVMLVVAVLINAGVPGLVPASWTRTAGAAGEATSVSDELQKKLEALLAAIEEGRLSAADMKASLEQMKDMMAKVDPELQKKIDQLLKDKPLGDQANNKRMDLDKETLAERAERDKASSGGLPEDVRWALEDLASRLAQQSADRQTAKGNPAASQETGEKGMGSSQAEAAQATAAEAAMQMVREAASEADAAKMMMGGGGMMGGDSRSGAGGNNGKETGAADALLIAQALRKEILEATSDTLGANINKEDLRRKTEQGTSSLGFTRVQVPAGFERGRADAPQPVPEARRDLLLKYFIRR